MEEQQAQQTNHHKPRLSNELRHLIFQEMLSLKVSDSLPPGTFKRIAQTYGYHQSSQNHKKFMEASNSNQRSCEQRMIQLIFYHKFEKLVKNNLNYCKKNRIIKQFKLIAQLLQYMNIDFFIHYLLFLFYYIRENIIS